MSSFRKRIGRTAIATVLPAGIAIGATVLSTSTPSLAANNSGTVTFALSPGVTPCYILPIMSGADFSNVNFFQFQEMMFRPLYWSGKGTSPTFNESLALPLVYSNGGKTVTVKLKSYNWPTASQSPRGMCSSL